MLKFKLLIVGVVSEQHVASFRTASEAFHSGSLLQASTEDTNLHYYVEFREKGALKRQAVDRFARRLPFLNKQTTDDLKQYYSTI